MYGYAHGEYFLRVDTLISMHGTSLESKTAWKKQSYLRFKAESGPSTDSTAIPVLSEGTSTHYVSPGCMLYVHGCLFVGDCIENVTLR